MPQNRLQTLLLISAGIVFAVYVALRLTDIISVIDLRDYRTYYYAAQAYWAGEDPYDLAVLSRRAGFNIGYAFVYPKFSLIFFVPLSFFDYQTSALVFVCLKAIFMIALVFLWFKYFLSDFFYSLLLSVLLIGAYHGTVVRDFAVGNVSVFEQLFLWLAFLFFLQKKMKLFYMFIVASALFKFTSMVFLFLPLVFHRDKTTLFSVGVSVVLLVVYYLGSYLGHPQIADRFSNLQWEGSFLNPSFFALTKDILKGMGVEPHELMKYTYSIFALYALVVVLASFFVLKKAEIWKNPSVILIVAIFLYALLLPRFKDYSYILLIVPSLIVLRDIVHSNALKLIGVLLVCVHLYAYQSLFAAFFLFVTLLVGIRQLSPAYTMVRSSSPGAAAFP